LFFAVFALISNHLQKNICIHITVMKAMFAADDPIKYIPPVVKRKMPPYGGCAQFVGQMETTPPEPRPVFENPIERRARQLQEKLDKNNEACEAEAQNWDPHNPPTPTNGDLTQDAYKTLFVARLSQDTTSHKLRREFEHFGPIKTLRVVQDKDGESRGYAFVEYENEADMKEAYKRTDGRKIDGQRVVVDVERGRTVRKWRPRRFGGGLGNVRQTRKKGERAPVVVSGRVG
jgi:U1 small nuclear ribonucleoprotein 70kDa